MLVQLHAMLKPHLYFYTTQSWIQAIREKGKSGQTSGKQMYEAIFNSDNTTENLPRNDCPRERELNH